MPPSFKRSLTPPERPALHMLCSEQLLTYHSPGLNCLTSETSNSSLGIIKRSLLVPLVL